MVPGRHGPFLFLFLFLSVLISPATGLSQGQKIYEECLINCEAKFERVFENEESCSVTLAHIHSDLKLIQETLTEESICKGRHKQACLDFREYALASLERLIAHTLNPGDCLEVDAKAIQDDLWLLDLAKACKGDGIYTDLHDFLGGKRNVMSKVLSAGTYYSVVKEVLDPYEDFRGHRPDCDGGSQPVRHFIDPLFKFYLALDSLIPYQACMPSCRAPTEREVKLWSLESTVKEIRKNLDKFSTALRNEDTVRKQRLMDQHGMVFPCLPVSEQLAALKAHGESVNRLESTLRELLENPDQQLTLLPQLEEEIIQLSTAVSDGTLQQAINDCRQEDERAAGLMERRAKVVDTILRGETFSIDAARTFADREGPDAPCSWIGDCAIPLTCQGGKCSGSVTVTKVHDMLDASRDLADRGRELTLHSDKGLNLNAQRQIFDVEKELEAAEKQLAGLGWQEAVHIWREAYRKEFPARLDKLAADVADGLDQGEEAKGERRRPPRPCRRILKRLKQAGEAVEQVRNALGDPDPITRARWIHLKSIDVTDIQAELDDALASLDDVCAPPESGLLPGWLWWVLGGLVIALIAFAAVILKRRKK
jgi:hypothetical protein